MNAAALALAPPAGCAAVVIDTNIALDLLVFWDPGVEALRDGLTAGRLQWLATARMRLELARVLDYPKLQPRLAAAGLEPPAVLAGFDRLSRAVPAPSRACLACRDVDDQMFVDLAVAHRCLLLSKDRDLLAMKKKLLMFQVVTSTVAAAHNSGPSALWSPL